MNACLACSALLARATECSGFHGEHAPTKTIPIADLVRSHLDLWRLLRDIRDAVEYGDADDWHGVAARLRHKLREAPRL